MQLIRFGAAAVNVTPLDWDGNRRRIEAALSEARELEVAVLCLPEMCITGYGCEDAFLSASVARTAWDVLRELLPATRGIVTCLGLPVRYRNAVYNTAAMVADGEILGFAAKRFLAGDGIHYEPRWFKAWPQGVRGELTVQGASYAIGDLHFEVDGLRIGFEICEDAWVAQRPGAALAQIGIDVILNPSASHFAFGKQEVRERFVLEGSRAFGVAYLYSSLLGNEAGRIIYDGGPMIASEGRLVARGRRFSFADHTLTSAVVDIDLNRMQQARLAAFQPELEAHESTLIQSVFRFPRAETPERTLAEPSLEEGDRRFEEFTRAEALGLFDYLRKSRSRGFVVSLSGGADSAAVACLVALSVRLCVSEIGIEGLRARLDGLVDLSEGAEPHEIVHRLLTCVYQGTANSSETTRNAARQVAEAIGARFHEIEIEELVKGYVDRIAEKLGRPLTWERDDISLQNIQARVRSPGVWLLANLQNCLLLATSNLSEAAVGYATMDGDTSGGLSPIAGIDKAFLRSWLRWMETQGTAEIGTIPALAAINAQEPTAELRPLEKGQTDEHDLMPYEVLDVIERAAIRDKYGPLEVFQSLRARYPDEKQTQLAFWTERFFRLWSRNQWKRERYAPSFHLDERNLDPKTWCRFPILSGGFERELRELKEVVDAL